MPKPASFFLDDTTAARLPTTTSTANFIAGSVLLRDAVSLANSMPEMQPSDQDVRLTQMREVVAVAQAMIDGDVDLVLGLRRIVKLVRLLDLTDDPTFAGIIGFEDQTEDYISGPNRANWAAEYLERIDRSTERYVDQEAPSVLQDCRRVVDVPEFEISIEEARERSMRARERSMREARERGWEVDHRTFRNADDDR